MAKTKYPGGAYLSTNGTTWHDANGKVIPSPLTVAVVTPKEAEPAVIVAPEIVTPIEDPAPVAVKHLKVKK